MLTEHHTQEIDFVIHFFLLSYPDSSPAIALMLRFPSFEPPRPNSEKIAQTLNIVWAISIAGAKTFHRNIFRFLILENGGFSWVALFFGYLEKFILIIIGMEYESV